MDWEDLPLPEQENDVFTYAARELMDERLFPLISHPLNCYLQGLIRRYRGRAYCDGRSWRQRTERLQANWAPRLDEMLEAYLKWKYTTSPESPPASPTATSASDPHTESRPGSTEPIAGYNFTIEVLDIYTMTSFVDIPRGEDSKSVAEALMFQGYIGNTPETPTVALSVRTLQLFRHIRLCKPLFSIEAFAWVLCDLYNVRMLKYNSAVVLQHFTGSVPSAIPLCTVKCIRHISNNNQDVR